MKKILIIVAVLIILGGIAGFVLLQNNNKQTSPVTSSQITPIPQEANAVSIENFSFNPSEIIIKKGTELTWTNNDSAPHTITSDAGVFQSENLSQGQTYKFTFNEAGTFSYHCSIHPSMTGKVVVE